ncbi:MAG TPA: hypothetical protein VI793_18270 [Anaerolineales bacterium]|nr:hypothetical protein [Anaerolineales bacterium]
MAEMAPTTGWGFFFFLACLPSSLTDNFPSMNPDLLLHLAEQCHIVANIKNLFAQAEAIERAVGVARRRAERVDQAILARAFRGEL